MMEEGIEMTMTPKFFVNAIIRPANTALGFESPQAEQLMLGTAIHESGLLNIQQYDGGPAAGYFQEEEFDHNDLLKNYVAYHPRFLTALKSLLPSNIEPSFDCIMSFPIYAAAICRLHYERAPGEIPFDLPGQAAYYKSHYNTPAGAATTQEYINKWNSLVGEDAIANWQTIMEM
jgi:hypothetical protein